MTTPVHELATISADKVQALCGADGDALLAPHGPEVTCELCRRACNAKLMTTHLPYGLEETAMTTHTPPVGTIVRYRQRRGSNAWLPAVVTVTEETYVAGTWQEVNSTGHERGDFFVRENAHGRQASLGDADGEAFVPSELPPVKEGRLHLRVFSPTCSDYAEFNVRQGSEPGCWDYVS